MAKKTKAAKKSAKKTPVERILGIAKAGTTKGNVLEVLMDGKSHSLESLDKCRVIERDSIGWRITMLKEAGKHADRPFKIVEDDDEVRLVYLKNGASKSEAKPVKKASKKAGHVPSKASVQDVPVADED